MGGVGEPDRARHPTQFLGHERVHELVAAEPAPGLVDRDSHHVQVREVLEHLGREPRLVLDLLGDRLDFGLAKVPNRLPYQPVFLGERKVHN